MDDRLKLIRESIRDIADFPKPGILFRDITPLLAKPPAFLAAIELFSERYADKQLDQIVAVDARGFILGAPLAINLKLPLQIVRKPGKLPGPVHEIAYALEYGENRLAIHQDAINRGDRVVIIDDLLATGGTVGATVKLVEKLGGKVVECAFLIELVDLAGRKAIPAESFALLSL